MRFHGVLLDVGGVGVLLAGPSGVGKSECALELVARGHRLVADDAVELAREGEGVRGRPAEAIGTHMEIRGLGILSVPELYGPDAVAASVQVDLVCRLEPEAAAPDRTGLDRAHQEILGVEIPCVVLSPRAGASLATVVDAAARDHLQRSRGPSAAERFDADLRERMARRS